jgi:hypothetical protein
VNAWPVPSGDPRHPHWCQRAYCEMYRPKSLRQHRSAPVAVQLDEPVMTARTEIWLSQAIDAPLDEAKVDVNVRITEEVAGEVTSVDTWSFDVAEARQVASLMLLLARRGAERRYVDPIDWR